MTTAEFSLLDEAWVPVLDMHGRALKVSLRGLFADAGQIRMIACELPTQTFAVLRLALAILHRATGGPPGDAAWRKIWQAPAPAFGEVQAYLDAYADRFDLLHPEHPFYQVARLRTAKGEAFGLKRIIADVPNGSPFLTTRAGPGMERITPAEAAIWVVHCQAYDPSGIKSGAVGDSRVKGGKGYPIGTASVGSLGGMYLERASLQETLLLNLVPTGGDWLPADDRDLPVWERPQLGPDEEPAVSRGPYGVLSLYTWQSRRLRLYADADGITGAMVANGDKIEWQNRHLMEPLSVWGRSGPREREQKKVPIYLPRAHDHTKALWRGLETLLPPPTTGGEPAMRLSPMVLRWLARLRMTGVIDRGFQVTTRAASVTYGTQQAVTDEVFGDALTMSVQVVTADSELRTTVVDSVADAETAVVALRALARNLARAAGASDADSGAAGRAAVTAYAQLDQTFRAWLAHLGPDSDPIAERTRWQKSVLRDAARLGHDLIAAAGPAAWVGRTETTDSGPEIHLCSSQAEAWFRASLRKALPLTAETPVTAQAATRTTAQEVPA